MLNQGIKILALSFLVLFFSCKDKVMSKEEQEEYDRMEMQIANKTRKIYSSFSKRVIGEKEYNEVYKIASDSIANWRRNNIAIFQYGQLDSLLCFNSKKDRFFGALLERYPSKKDYVQDYIIEFFGVKIKGKWYFFRGSTLVLPREYYHDDINKAISFEKIKQLAITHSFSNYLIKVSDNSLGKFRYQINNKVFIDMESNNGDGTFGGGGNTFEEMVLRIVNENWRGERDTIE